MSKKQPLKVPVVFQLRVQSITARAHLGVYEIAEAELAPSEIYATRVAAAAARAEILAEWRACGVWDACAGAGWDPRAMVKIIASRVNRE